MHNSVKKRAISLFSALALALILTVGQSGAIVAPAAEGDLGTQTPAITASYTDSDGNACDGNALTSGSYTMTLSVSDLASISELEFTASYDTDILSFSLLGSTILSDTLPQLDGIGPLISGGSFIFGLMSENEDKTLLPDNAAQLLSVGITVSSETPVDMNDVITVNVNPVFTFIEVDFGDVYHSDTGLVYDCYGLSSPADFLGAVYDMTCDLSPDITQYYSVSAYVGALISPDETYGTFPTTGAAVTISTENGDISAVTDSSGRFTLENVPNGEYTATVTYKYGFSREFTIVVNGADIDSDIMVGIVGCDWNSDGLINVNDYTAYFNLFLINDSSESYDVGIDINRDNIINVNDYNVYFSFFLKDSASFQYSSDIVISSVPD